jgi:DNA-directed RNA polymerase subunit beta
MEFVAERLRGEVARFDITDKAGKVIVEKDKRITAAPRARSSSRPGPRYISVPEDFLVGRVRRAQRGRHRTPARSWPRPTTS